MIGFNILSTIYGHVIAAPTMHACSSSPVASCCATSWRWWAKIKITTTKIPICSNCSWVLLLSSVFWFFRFFAGNVICKASFDAALRSIIWFGNQICMQFLEDLVRKTRKYFAVNLLWIRFGFFALIYLINSWTHSYKAVAFQFIEVTDQIWQLGFDFRKKNYVKTVKK